jgi:hypothetical protein
MASIHGVSWEKSKIFESIPKKECLPNPKSRGKIIQKIQ